MQALSNSKGFTLIELVVVITVMGILMGVILGTLGDFYQSNTTSLGQTTQDTDTRGVLRSIEKELTNSAGFEPALTVSVPLGADNGTEWSYKGTDADNRVLIGTSYATDKAPTDETRMVKFANITGTGCDPSIDTAVKNALIYFTAPDPDPTKMSSADPTKRQYNLYRRTVVNTTGLTMCGTAYQKQTCSSTSAPAHPAVCTGTDAVLLRDVSSMTVDYHTSSNGPKITDQYGSPAEPISGAKSIYLTVVTNQRINGTNKQNTASIRISRSY